MKLNFLYFAITAVFLIASCQPKILPISINQPKTDSLINTKTTVDTLARINSKLKVDTLARIDSKIEVEDFTLSIEPIRFKNATMGKAKIVITNNTKEHVLAGTLYLIDFYEDNIWKRLDLNKNIVFEAIGYDINAFSSREFEVNLKILPYDYKPGKYRIIKDVIQTSNKKRVVISTAFFVE